MSFEKSEKVTPHPNAGTNDPLAPNSVGAWDAYLPPASTSSVDLNMMDQTSL